MSGTTWGSADTKYFYDLTPEKILDAVEHSLAIRSTGRTLALNSMENRVYEIEMDLETKLRHERFRIAKFYRPGRWTKAQILEEHAFLHQLVEDEIPVAAPLILKDGGTLGELPESGILYAIFNKCQGRSPQELTFEELERVGRLLARLHNVGATRPFEHRLALTAESYGSSALRAIEDTKLMSADVATAFHDVVMRLVDKIGPLLERFPSQRIHGDCHLGNLLWGEAGFFWVDFDDSLMGPPMQDVWLLAPGRDAEAVEQTDILLTAYETMRDFDRGSIILKEPLRALRMIHFSAWIGKRWQDPAFPRAFPQFGTERYWREQIADLEEQAGLIGAV